MHDYLISPLAPLVLRGGKPVDANTGNDVLVFPQPSTLAGTLRAACAISQGMDFSKERTTIESWPCSGPLLAAVDDGNQTRPLFAKPLDVFYTKPTDDGKEDLLLYRLIPQALRENEGCDLPDGLLQAVFFQEETKSKPVEGPAWWNQDAMTQWLCGEMPGAVDNKKPGISRIVKKDLGHAQLPTDVRYHVALISATLASDPGRLYQSAGRDFAALRKTEKLDDLRQRGWQSHRYALLARFGEDLEGGLLRLGGEGRLSALEARAGAWPGLPDKVRKALGKSQKGQKIRLILQTPALFGKGWLPDWLDEALQGSPPGAEGLELKLYAAASERWQPISGWDIQAKKPKAVRRLVPAGSVYWFEVLSEGFSAWDKLWLSSLCDEERDRRDGFGLAVPGVA
jgi:CRISPR-associated protein Cmr3